MRIRILPVFLLLSLVSASALAQVIPIHGGDVKPAYLSAAEWPFVSGQSHWGPSNGMPLTGDTSLLNPVVGHVHVECSAPLWGEVAAPLVLPCQLQVFHLAGSVAYVIGDEAGAVTWDSTGTTTAPAIVGDPMGVVVTPFHFRLNPPVLWASLRHGWVSASLHARTLLTNGTVLDTSVSLPFYSAVDLSAPEVNIQCDGCGPRFRVTTEPHSPNDHGGLWGEVIVDTFAQLPIYAPATTLWNTTFHGYAYADSPGAPSLSGVAEGREDIDLHHGIEGRLIPFGRYDPALLGAGVHRIAMLWREDTGAGNATFAANETAISLLVVTVTVPGSPLPPPPETCQTPGATNLGGPLPCAFPPPVNTWHLDGTLGSLTLWHDDTNRTRICGANQFCAVQAMTAQP